MQVYLARVRKILQFLGKRGQDPGLSKDDKAIVNDEALEKFRIAIERTHKMDKLGRCPCDLGPLFPKK